MTQIIAVAVPKGGTGKTTTTLNLGAALHERGKQVLAVDFDPQGNLTRALGFGPCDLTHTVYTAIQSFLTTYEPALEQAIVSTNAGIDLVQANVRLNLANSELTTALSGEFVLQKLLDPILSRYDVVLIDTLPYLGILVVNALVIAQSVLIPLETEYLATESVGLMLDQVRLMRKSGLNRELNNGRVVTVGAYFGQDVQRIVERLLSEQMADGGWNCEQERGATRGSFHTTICVLEGLGEHQQATGGSLAETTARERGGHAYLLERHLFRRRSTGEIDYLAWTQFSFPTGYHYDVLRGLEYLRRAGVAPDARMAEAIDFVASKRDADGRWLLENVHPDQLDAESGVAEGQPSRWNTLRALRMLDWYESARDETPMS